MECVVPFGYTEALSEEYKKELKKISAFLNYSSSSTLTLLHRALSSVGQEMFD